MDSEKLPSDLPETGESRIAQIIATVVVLVIVGVILACWLGSGYLARQRSQGDVVRAYDLVADEEHQKMFDAIKSGKVFNDDAALNRIKEQLQKTNSQLDGRDAAMGRAMVNFIEKMQIWRQDCLVAQQHMQQADILSFNLPTRATIDKDQKIVRDFLTCNARIIEILQHGDDLIRAEMDAEKVPSSARDQLFAGHPLTVTQVTPYRLRIRICDKMGAENALAVLDLLKQNWGFWQRDATGNIRFDDEQTGKTFTALIQKIQANAAEEQQAQQEMTAMARASH